MIVPQDSRNALQLPQGEEGTASAHKIVPSAFTFYVEVLGMRLHQLRAVSIKWLTIRNGQQMIYNTGMEPNVPGVRARERVHIRPYYF
jgi:hypothetical protein